MSTMSDTPMTLETALRTAIEHEHKVRDHYAKGAAIIADTQGRRVFETLAREEQGHCDYLTSRLDEWSKTGAIQVRELTTILPNADWIRQAGAKAARDPQATLAVQGELELLKVALELEHASSAFYRALVDTLGATDRLMFARFLEIENAHLAIVQAEIDALAGHGHWFDIMEFSLEAQ